jgi:hypothetical protein
MKAMKQDLLEPRPTSATGNSAEATPTAAETTSQEKTAQP